MIRAGVPPPPSEVKVRTMHSDLESMAKSGGGMPRFQDVEVSNLSIEKEYTTPAHAANLATPAAAAAIAQAPDALSHQGPAITAPANTVTTSTVVTTSTSTIAPGSGSIQQTAAPRKDMYPIFIVAVVAILALGGVGYFAYITFFTGSSAPSSLTTSQTSTSTLPTAGTTASSTTANSTTPPTTTTPSAPVTTTPPPAASQTATLSAADELSSPHVSLFKKPADQVITVDLSGVNASSYRKIMMSSLTTVHPTASMIEITPTANDGSNINIQGLLAVAGTSLLNQSALASLNPDATFFVYRDKNGLWPGYILALGAGKTASSIAADVQQVEQSTSIGNLFLTNPGTPSSDGFTDSVTAGVSTRVLPFSGVNFPLYFSYGWDGNDLILSTSNNGFAAAAASLQ